MRRVNLESPFAARAIACIQRMGTSRPSRLARSVREAPNHDVWAALGEELRQPEQGRPRDPYWEQGCHPDVVSRLWNELGAELPGPARAQAKGRPVLAH